MTVVHDDGMLSFFPVQVKTLYLIETFTSVFFFLLLFFGPFSFLFLKRDTFINMT